MARRARGLYAVGGGLGGVAGDAGKHKQAVQALPGGCVREAREVYGLDLLFRDGLIVGADAQVFAQDRLVACIDILAEQLFCALDLAAQDVVIGQAYKALICQSHV